MKLAVFDIDGTLTQTNEVDNACFRRAFAEALAVTEIGISWETCPHVTDSGITRHIFRHRLDRDPDEVDEARIRERFMALLRHHHRLDVSLFTEVPGASAMLMRLRRDSEWVIAFATGCWQESADFKLGAAGIESGTFPAAFAEDGPSREQIVQTAVTRALAHYGQSGFEKIVSVGDGLWDVRTAAQLNLAFLGIGGDERAKALGEGGARHVIEDFSDFGRFFRCLNQAEVPRSAKASSS